MAASQDGAGVGESTGEAAASIAPGASGVWLRAGSRLGRTCRLGAFGQAKGLDTTSAVLFPGVAGFRIVK